MTNLSHTFQFQCFYRELHYLTRTTSMQIILLTSAFGILMLAWSLWEWKCQLVFISSVNRAYGSNQNRLILLETRSISAHRTILLETSGGAHSLSKVFHNIAGREMHHTSTAMNKNFGLTESEFNRLLLELEKGDESLFEQVFLTHFEDCCKYLMSTYNASSEDAYDASMSTMLEFCKRLKSGRIAYGNLRFLFTRMAGQVYLKWIKKQNKLIGLENIDLQEAPEEIDDETYATLNKAWDGLLKDCQTLLEAFYYSGATLEHIATELNRSAVAVRKQKQRCMEKLRELFVSISLPEN